MTTDPPEATSSPVTFELVVDPDSVPPKVRTAAYYILLVVSALVLLATGLAPIWLSDDLATRIVATCGVITGVAGLVAGGLGVAYRPTRTST
jgi:hypothetical protein